MLDRLAALPGGAERHPADPLITVVEVLAHVADRLSYRQDAAGTEAYLGTARSRISVRRHARLLDYAVHDGCAARAWLSVRVTAGSDVESRGVPAGTPVLAADRATPAVRPADAAALLACGATGFETLTPLAPRAARNEIALYVWGGRDSACPSARPGPPWSTCRRPAWPPVTCCCWRRCSPRRPGDAPTRTPPTGRWSGWCRHAPPPTR